MDDFERMWSALKNQSERQFGAFLFAYLQENRKPCKMLPNSHVEMRNDVIHKGRIPNKAEATAFAQRSVNYIKDRIKEIPPENLHAFTLFLINNQKSNYSPDSNSVVTWTVLSESYEKPLGEEFDLSSYLVTLTKFRYMW